MTRTYSGIVNCTSKIGTADATNVTLNFASGKTTTLDAQGGETLTLLDLPIGTKWTVCEGTELTQRGHAGTPQLPAPVNNVDVASASGKIENTNQNDTVTITNTDYADYTPTGRPKLTIPVSKELREEGKSRLIPATSVSPLKPAIRV